MTKIEILTNTKTIFKKKEKFLKFQRKKLFDPFLNFKRIKNKILETEKTKISLTRIIHFWVYLELSYGWGDWLGYFAS